MASDLINSAPKDGDGLFSKTFALLKRTSFVFGNSKQTISTLSDNINLNNSFGNNNILNNSFRGDILYKGQSYDDFAGYNFYSGSNSLYYDVYEYNNINDKISFAGKSTYEDDYEEEEYYKSKVTLHINSQNPFENVKFQTRISQILHTHQGRDKLFKVCQYSIRLYLWAKGVKLNLIFVEGANSDSFSIAEKNYMTVVNSRRLFKLGRMVAEYLRIRITFIKCSELIYAASVSSFFSVIIQAQMVLDIFARMLMMVKCTCDDLTYISQKRFLHSSIVDRLLYYSARIALPVLTIDLFLNTIKLVQGILNARLVELIPVEHLKIQQEQENKEKEISNIKNVENITSDFNNTMQNQAEKKVHRQKREIKRSSMQLLMSRTKNRFSSGDNIALSNRNCLSAMASVPVATNIVLDSSESSSITGSPINTPNLRNQDLLNFKKSTISVKKVCSGDGIISTDSEVFENENSETKNKLKFSNEITNNNNLFGHHDFFPHPHHLSHIMPSHNDEPVSPLSQKHQHHHHQPVQHHKNIHRVANVTPATVNFSLLNVYANVDKMRKKGLGGDKNLKQQQNLMAGPLSDDLNIKNAKISAALNANINVDSSHSIVNKGSNLSIPKTINNLSQQTTIKDFININHSEENNNLNDIKIFSPPLSPLKSSKVQTIDNADSNKASANIPTNNNGANNIVRERMDTISSSIFNDSIDADKTEGIKDGNSSFDEEFKNLIVSNYLSLFWYDFDLHWSCVTQLKLMFDIFVCLAGIRKWNVPGISATLGLLSGLLSVYRVWTYGK